MIDFFTKQEKFFISFLIAGLLVGSGIKLYQSHFKTVNDAVQTKKIDDFEKEIIEKAALIDSSIDKRAFSVEKDTFSINKKIFVFNDTRGKSNQRILLVEINTASVDELVQLPRIGPVIANRIIEYRNANGAFKNIADLVKVKGIGQKKLESIKPFIYIKDK